MIYPLSWQVRLVNPCPRSSSRRRERIGLRSDYSSSVSRGATTRVIVNVIEEWSADSASSDHRSLVRSSLLASCLAMCMGVSRFHSLRGTVKRDECTDRRCSFARDGGLPGKRFFGKTSSSLGLPVNGFLLHSVIQCALACIYFGSLAAFNAFLGVSVLSLGGACFLPILISFCEGRNKIKGAKYYKGKFGFFCNV